MHNVLLAINNKLEYDKEAFSKMILLKMREKDKDLLLDQDIVISENLKIDIVDFENKKSIVNVTGKEKFLSSSVNNLVEACAQGNEFDITILFSSMSNDEINKEYSRLYLLETLVRILFSSTVISYKNISLFESFNRLDKKGMVELDQSKRQNLEYSFEMCSFDSLLSFINSNWLGGDEYRQLKDKFDELKVEDNFKDEYKKFIRQNIFKEISSVVDNQKMIKEYRNSISHNRIVDVIGMREISDEINKYIEKFKELFNSCQLIYCDIESVILTSEKAISYVYENRTEDYIPEIIVMRILSEFGMVYDKDLLVNAEDCIEYNQNSLKIKIKKLEDSGDINIINVLIKCCSEELSIQKVYKHIVASEALVLFDTQSFDYCNNLAKQVTIVENTLRMYFSLINYKSPDFNLIKDSKNNSGTVSYAGKINKNSFYDVDFIKLQEPLKYPTSGNDISKNKNRIVELIDNNIEEIELIFSKISDSDDNIGEIYNLINEIYAYRTICAHYGLMSKNDFEIGHSYNTRCLSLLYKSFNNLIRSDFNKYTFENVRIENNNVEIFIEGDLWNIKIFTSEKSEILISDITQIELFRFINNLVENKDSRSFIISDNHITDYFKNLEIDNDVLVQEDILRIVDNINLYNHYSEERLDSNMQKLAAAINQSLNDVDKLFSTMKNISSS